MFGDSQDHLSVIGQKKMVILLAGTRTGSTFLGQLFNQNPNILYIHEPFQARHLLELREYGLIPEADERSTLDELQMFWLRQVMDRCDTGDLVLEPEQERYGECGTGGENLMRFNSEECHLNYTQTPRSELCILRDTVVMKINRLLQLDWLSDITDAMAGVDLKIIHLLRDPRDVIKSRFKFKHYYYKDRFPVTHEMNVNNKVGLAAEEWCIRELDNIVYAERDPPAWLADNYLLIRFEEIVEDPLAIAEELYEFIGSEVPASVREWVSNEGGKVLDTRADSVVYPDKWNSTYNQRVEEECKPLIIKMGLQFQELNITYTESYY